MAQTAGQCSVLIVLPDKVETTFLGWIPVTNCFGVVRLQMSVGVQKRNLFVILAYADTQKDEF